MNSIPTIEFLRAIKRKQTFQKDSLIYILRTNEAKITFDQNSIKAEHKSKSRKMPRKFFKLKNKASR